MVGVGGDLLAEFPLSVFLAVGSLITKYFPWADVPRSGPAAPVRI